MNTKEKYLKVEKLYNEGKSLREIGKEIGTSYQTVATIIHKLRDAGVKIPYRIKKSTPEQIAEERNN